MSDDTPVGKPMDWPTAEVHLNKLVNEYRSVALLHDLIATGNEARHWMEANTQEIAGRTAEIAKLKKETETAAQAAVTAKRLQAAAEENAKRAEAEAKTVEEQAKARSSSAEENKAKRLSDLEAQIAGRRTKLESDHAARVAHLDEQIGAKQAELSEVTAAIEALRAGLPRAK